MRRDRVQEREGRLTMSVERRRLGVHDERERATGNGLFAPRYRRRRRRTGFRRLRAGGEDEGQYKDGRDSRTKHGFHPLGAECTARGGKKVPRRETDYETLTNDRRRWITSS